MVFFYALADVMYKFSLHSASDELRSYQEWIVSSSFERPIGSAVREDSRFLEVGLGER